MPDDAPAPLILLPAPSSGTIKLVIYVFSVIIIVFGLTVLTIYLSLLPSKPSFTLEDITVSSFNISTTRPYLISTSMQVTISTRNSMSRVAIIYERLTLYATYRNEQITLPYSLPETFQEHKEVSVWSPYLEGHASPISPISGPVLIQDLNYGALLVLVKIEGNLKFRVAGWRSGTTYRLYTHCPAMIHLGDMNTKKDVAVSAKEFKFQLVQNCHVEISW